LRTKAGWTRTPLVKGRHIDGTCAGAPSIKQSVEDNMRAYWNRWMAALCCLFLTTAAQAQSAPLIKLEAGTVRGSHVDGLSVFKGVPFAAPPVGPLRWHAPEQPTPWQGVLDGTHFAPACPQTGMPDQNQGGMRTSEDCLYVNVWTPTHAGSAPLPVMVWIYGGGFTQGATSISTYSGSRLAQKGVVVVSIAYRV